MPSLFFEQLRVVFKQQEERKLVQEARKRELARSGLVTAAAGANSFNRRRTSVDAMDAVYTTDKRQLRK